MTTPASETPPSKSTASQAPPVVLTAAQRQEFARHFDEVQRLAHRAPPDYRAVHAKLAEICTLDPGNTHFVAVLLENLKNSAGKTSSAWFWQVWKLRAELQQAIQRKEWTKALRAGWSLLGEVPNDAELLRQLAEVCAALDHGPTQIILLRAARNVDPKSVAVLRPLALALSVAGQFDEAAATWLQLRTEVPFDPEAQKYLGILNPERRRLATSSTDLAGRVRDLLGAKLWEEAEQLLSAESGAVGANLELRSLGEEISVGRAVERYLIACALEQVQSSPAMQQLVAAMQNEWRRIELGVAFARYERFPSEAKSSWELARCLADTGNYSESMKYLKQIPHDSIWGDAALIAIAETWQRLRQFDRALAAYQTAFNRPEFRPHKSLEENSDQDALSQGAKLAEAMGEYTAAICWLERLLAVNPTYKDAQPRLDNLRAICHKGGFPAGRPTGA